MIWKRPNRKRFRRGDAGLTLLEVMFASTVLIVLVVMLFGALLQFYLVQEISKQRTIALSHIGSVIEELQSASFSELIDYVPPELPGLGAEATVTVALIDGEGEKLSLPMQEPDEDLADTLPNPVEVEVTVRWKDQQHREYSRSVSAMVGR